MPRSRAIVIGLVAIVVIGIGAYVAYDQILRGDSAPALALPTAAPSASSGPASADPSTDASAGPVGSFAGDVNGTWTAASGSQAGYRVREQLANLPAESDAVGRTDQVTGSIELAADASTTTLTGGTITVDTTAITSDESRRDQRLQSQGLQTDQFPTATFTITEPVEIPAAALEGTASDITLIGDLTLHGVTKSVQIPAQAQLVDGQVQVAGSITFPLSDFDIVAPNIGGSILSIADEGTLEFSVAFTKP